MSIDYTANNNGDLTHEGRVIHLTDGAEATNYSGYGDTVIRYVAYGVDDQGTKYQVAWDTTPEWGQKIEEGHDPAGDYEDACDWGSPVEVREV